MDKLVNHYEHIKGWAVDADPDNEPTYPMKKYTGDDHNHTDWQRPSQQVPDQEILKSNERPELTAVFGNSVPLSGLSGAIRKRAFGYSESMLRHWFPLMLADRINVVEGVIEDIKQGVYPNVVKESGLRSELKHNAAGYAQKVASRVALVAGLACLSYLALRKKK